MFSNIFINQNWEYLYISYILYFFFQEVSITVDYILQLQTTVIEQGLFFFHFFKYITISYIYKKKISLLLNI